MIKIFVVLLAILLGIWLWKRGRQEGRDEAVKAAKKPKATSATVTNLPRPIIPCLHCGTHLDLAETVQGRLGRYCSKAHCNVHGDKPLD